MTGTYKMHFHSKIRTKYDKIGNIWPFFSKNTLNYAISTKIFELKWQINLVTFPFLLKNTCKLRKIGASMTIEFWHLDAEKDNLKIARIKDRWS